MTTMITSGQVAVGATAHEIAHTLVQVPVLPGLSWQAYRTLTHVVATLWLRCAIASCGGPVVWLDGRRSRTCRLGCGAIPLRH